MTDYFLLTSLAAIFGSSFIFTAISVRDISPATVVTARLGIAFLVIYLLMRVKGESLPAAGKIWVYIVAASTFGNAVPFLLVSWGQVKVEAGLTAIFMAVMPLATIILAQFFTDDEKLNRWKIASVVCGLVGVVVLMGPSNLSNVGDNTLRQAAILATAVCYAINAILTRKLVSLPRLPMVGSLLLVSTIMVLPLCLIVDKPWQQTYESGAALSIVILALGPTALATWLVLLVIDRQGASFLSQINFMVPLFGVFLGTVFLHERLPVNAYIALVIILFAIALSRQGSRR